MMNTNETSSEDASGSALSISDMENIPTGQLVSGSIKLYGFMVLASLFWIITTAAALSAQDAAIPAELKLEQFAITSHTGSGQYVMQELNENQGLLTFLVKRRVDAAYLKSSLFETWIETEKILIGGNSLNVQEVSVIDEQTIQIVYEMSGQASPDLRMEGSGVPLEYMETDIVIEATDNFRKASERVTMYRQMNMVMHISVKGARESMADRQISSRQMHEVVRTREIEPFDLPAFLLVESPADHQELQKSFISRNRYWLLGTAAVLIAGGAILLTSSEDPPFSLPEPPGRP